MPIGLNLQVDFDTQASQPDKSTYPFNTGDGPEPPQPLGAVDAYHGSDVVGHWFVFTEYNFPVCEYYVDDALGNILEYNRPCPESWIFHSQSVEFELTTDERNVTNINLHLCEYAFNTVVNGRLIFEYTNLCAELSFTNGSTFVAALATAGRDLKQRYDLALCCPYDKPENGQNTIIFEYNDVCEFFHVVAGPALCEIDGLTFVPRDYKQSKLR